MVSGYDSDLDRLEQLVHAALERPESEREAFLDEACAGEPGLRARVDALLARHAEGASLAPPLGRGAPAPGLGPGPDGGLMTEGPGTLIGRYKLLQRLGEGGFGVVYMAEQTEPVRRKVALKILKLGMDTREVVARFEAERQALALMEHPGIAKVLDAGATDTGRPYFVMELVRGLPLTRFCDERGLGTRERLALFVQVCEAVQHAHQKGVIHRDLKPGNVLVELHDDRPVPKVIDFGIAKALTTRLTEKTLFTEYQRFLGTPAYMAPEQAGLSALDVDTRADIYSLGVLLYELLTGTTPFESRRLLAAGLAEIQRIIREEEPPKPSTRVTTLGDSHAASRRASDVAALARAVRGDLDWIVMKALEKERARRYGSAGDLAADIGRHLREEPVEAGPPGARYRAAKFLRRNRVGVGVASLLLLLLVGGITGTTLGYIESARNAREAEANAEQAERRLQEVLAAEQRRELLRDYLFDTLALADPEIARDPEVSVKDLLDRAAAAIPERLDGEPAVQAQVHAILGAAYMNLSQPALAFEHLTRAERLGRELGVFDGARRHELLWEATDAAFTLEREDAYAWANRSLQVGADHLRASGHPELADAAERFSVGTQDRESGIDRAEAAFADMRRLSGAAAPLPAELQIILAHTYQGGALALWYSPYEERSARYYEAALEHMRAALPSNHPDTANTLGLLAGVLNRAGRAAEAEPFMRASIATLREVYAEDSFSLGFARAMLGENLTRQGRFAEAEPELLASHEILAGVVRDAHNFYLLDSHSRLVRLYEAWGREALARPHRDALARVAWDYDYPMPWSYARQAFTAEQAALLPPMEALEALCDSPFVARRLEPARWPEARAAFSEVLALAPDLLADDDTRRVLVARQLLGWLAAVPAPPAWSADVVEQVTAWLEPGAERIPLDVAEALSLRALLRESRGQPGPAREDARRAHRLVRDAPSKDSWFTAASRVRTGTRLAELRLFAEAEDVLLASNATISEQLGAGHHWVAAAREALVRLYEAWGRDEQAARWRAADGRG